jgi:hypothetical protein
MDSFCFGNAGTEGLDQGGWFVGHMIHAGSPSRSTDRVGVKWGIHPAGSPRRAWVSNSEATTLSILVRGRFRILLPEADILLTREGDYALWAPGVPHGWLAEDDSVVLTVRWPSKEADSIEVATPIERLDPTAPIPVHRP